MKVKVVKGTEEADSLFLEFHASAIGAHCGQHRTREAISSRYYWPGMGSSIDNWLPSREPEGVELQSREPEGVELPSREPEGVELQSREPEGVELQSREPEGEELPPPEQEGKEVKSPPPPQPRPPPLRSSPAPPLCAVPRPLLLDTLPVCLDLPSLDLEPRSLQNRSQFSTWFHAPLLPSTKTSLRCSQTALELPLVTTLLPLGDWTSLHRAPAADLQCPGCRAGRP
ncbi:histone-lysine N-methyltransferase SETD1B-like isoform X1 [Acipenser ruthenus]|nr:histone-lysine N-methyltransferase SETD1B-like isoform X1 [Acipenser ruthenus]